ncbi:uncharacterized protein EI90DRAFT_3070160 [Cantharellus anzutake]|uniref:uncharacterized protein n=1 Tax=Cantharellus anzutake TaxID=1750568 RepID=UPI00190610B6|nr:uncharacterized protein EI90DRAFT_3070160 [Cantharellus anzutake]KAF8326682.1 hypothetical protein EI90DRAFT_3070160 [Cantharellus anzutake]
MKLASIYGIMASPLWSLILSSARMSGLAIDVGLGSNHGAHRQKNYGINESSSRKMYVMYKRDGHGTLECTSLRTFDGLAPLTPKRLIEDAVTSRNLGCCIQTCIASNSRHTHPGSPINRLRNSRPGSSFVQISPFNQRTRSPCQHVQTPDMMKDTNLQSYVLDQPRMENVHAS